MVDLVVGRIDDNGDGAVDSTDDVALAIFLDQSGFLSVAQYVPIFHGDPADPDDVEVMNDGALLAVLTVQDADGDTDTITEAIGDAVKIEDAAPVGGSLSVGSMQEDDLDGAPALSSGNDQDSSGTSDSATVAVEAGVSPGADAPVSYTIKDVDPNTLLPDLFSQGDQLTYVSTLEFSETEAVSDPGLVGGNDAGVTGEVVVDGSQVFADATGQTVEQIRAAIDLLAGVSAVLNADGELVIATADASDFGISGLETLGITSGTYAVAGTVTDAIAAYADFGLGTQRLVWEFTLDDFNDGTADATLALNDQDRSRADRR